MAGESKTISFSETQARWLESWQNETGQPHALVVRAAMNVFLPFLAERSLIDQIRLVTKFGDKDLGTNDETQHMRDEVARVLAEAYLHDQEESGQFRKAAEEAIRRADGRQQRARGSNA